MFLFFQASLLEWRLVFWVAFGVLVVTAIVYVIWASGEVQDFNDPPHRIDFEAEEKEKTAVATQFENNESFHDAGNVKTTHT